MRNKQKKLQLNRITLSNLNKVALDDQEMLHAKGGWLVDLLAHIVVMLCDVEEANVSADLVCAHAESRYNC